MNNQYLIDAGFEVCQKQEGFSELSGPFYEKKQGGYWLRALVIEAKHLNPEGVVHGGVLLSMTDYIVYRAIGDEITHDIQFATINLNTQFLAAAKLGDVIYGKGKITRKTHSVIFAEGELYTNERPIMSGTGIWKIIGR
ncbi:PaaI family thioesterase [Thalassotalea sp. M1531]|uniref:PaaI family thioesterase n=1 Tax=Thalassotalea algicola TaxID=2716224 RepID=A0A7Y0L942_9GAMM|nr:PaaI family thioesterase [Thalassotalea algicola]NMP30116.1 PaaI family thioesterase [Thalassotalea algicola]